MVDERAAKHFTIPRPLVLAGQRAEHSAVHRGKATAALDVILKRPLLIRVQNIAGHTQEHHSLELGQIRGGERASILCRLHCEFVRSTELADCGDAVGYRFVPITQRFREHQNSCCAIRLAFRAHSSET